MVNEVKAKLSESKKHLESLNKKRAELTSRLTDCREGLPVLQKAITEARQEREKVSDAVVLNEATTNDLEKRNRALEEAEKKYIDEQRLFDVLTREIKTLEGGIPKKMDEVESLKRILWETIGEEIKFEIPAKVFGLVEKWLSVKAQLGQPYEFALQHLFPRPNFEKIQEIQKDLSKKYEPN